MGQRTQAEAGAGERDRNEGVRGDGAEDGGIRSGARDSAETSLWGLQLWLAERNDAELVFMQTSWIFLSSLQSQWTAEAPREPRSVRKQ